MSQFKNSFYFVKALLVLAAIGTHFQAEAGRSATWRRLSTHNAQSSLYPACPSHAGDKVSCSLDHARQNFKCEKKVSQNSYNVLVCDKNDGPGWNYWTNRTTYQSKPRDALRDAVRLAQYQRAQSYETCSFASKFSIGMLEYVQQSFPDSNNELGCGANSNIGKVCKVTQGEKLLEFTCKGF